jgi:hypothetical protein
MTTPNEPVKNCETEVVDVLVKVARMASNMSAVEKHFLSRSAIAANLPLDILAGISIAIHASREVLKVAPKIIRMSALLLPMYLVSG